MLVVSRKEGEKIVIGDAVVTVTRIAGNRVRLGIEADSHVPVYRVRQHRLPRPKEQDDADGYRSQSQN